MPSHQTSHPHNPSTGEIPPPPTPHEQDQTAEMIAALDGQIAFHSEAATLAAQKAATASDAAERLTIVRDELLAKQQEEERRQAENRQLLQEAWVSQQESHKNAQAAKAREAANLIGLAAADIGVHGITPKDLTQGTNGNNQELDSFFGGLLDANGHVDASVPTSSATEQPTIQAPMSATPGEHVTPDLVINPDGSSKVVVTVDDSPDKSGNSKTPTPSSDRPIVITSADIPSSDSPDTSIPIPPQPIVGPVLPPPAPRSTGEQLPLPVAPTTTEALPWAAPTGTPASTTPPKASGETAIQKRHEDAKAELIDAQTELNEKLERYVRLSVINRKRTAKFGNDKKLEEANTELRSIIDSFATAFVEYHGARHAAGQYSPYELQTLEAKVQPMLQEFATHILNNRINEWTHARAVEIITNREQDNLNKFIQKPGESEPEFNLRKNEYLEKVIKMGLTPEETKELKEWVEQERQNGLTDNEKLEVEAYKAKRIGEGLSEDDSTALIRNYLTQEVAKIIETTAEGIYKGESKASQDKTKLAFRTSFAKDIAKIQDGKIRKYGRFAKKWGTVSLASLAGYGTGRMLGESGFEQGLKSWLASAAAARSVVGYVNRGLAAQEIGERVVNHPRGSSYPSNAIKRDTDGNIVSDGVDYGRAKTLAEERKHRAIVAATTRAKEHINNITLNEKDENGEPSRKPLKVSDFIEEVFTQQTREIRNGNRKRARASYAVASAVTSIAQANMGGGSGGQNEPTITPDTPPSVPDPTIATLP